MVQQIKRLDIKTMVEKLNKQLDLRKLEITKINHALNHYRGICKHKDLKIEDRFGIATCNICGMIFDWYCPTSPTLLCEYEQEDGSYDFDNCRYCHNPEERK